MSEISVSQLAKELKLESSRLVEQLQAAGVGNSIKEDTPLTEKDKAKLLDYLRNGQGGLQNKSRITLTRKKTTKIKKADSFGKARTIEVEVRKKRVIVKKPEDNEQHENSAKSFENIKPTTSLKNASNIIGAKKTEVTPKDLSNNSSLKINKSNENIIKAEEVTISKEVKTEISEGKVSKTIGDGLKENITGKVGEEVKSSKGDQGKKNKDSDIKSPKIDKTLRKSGATKRKEKNQDLKDWSGAKSSRKEPDLGKSKSVSGKSTKKGKLTQSKKNGEIMRKK